MYPPPPVIKTEIFARIPDAMRIRNRSSAWVDIQRHGKQTDCFLEGPSFDRDGNLYVVDVPWGRVFRISPAGDVTIVTDDDGEPNGLKIHKDGRIFIADYRNGLMLLDPGSGKVTALMDRAGVERFKGPNDLVFASNGDLYFTDQ